MIKLVQNCILACLCLECIVDIIFPYVSVVVVFLSALSLILVLAFLLYTKLSAGNGQFWQQNVIQDRKSFITQSKLMVFWWNKTFLRAYDLLLLSPEKKNEFDFGHGLCWPSFCPNRVVKEQSVKALAIFFFRTTIL